MNLLVDAQLPVRLVEVLTASGHDVVHTADLAEGNRTTDYVCADLVADSATGSAQSVEDVRP